MEYNGMEWDGCSFHLYPFQTGTDKLSFVSDNKCLAGPCESLIVLPGVNASERITSFSFVTYAPKRITSALTNADLEHILE